VLRSSAAILSPIFLGFASFTAAQAGFFILSQSGERPER
jgi:hypothetical protein